MDRYSQARSARGPVRLYNLINATDKDRPDGFWPDLERCVIRAVTAGGMAAMSYYRQSLPWPAELARQDEQSKNPSTLADLEATAALLQTLNTYLAPIARAMGCSPMYLGEETEYRDWLNKNVSREILEAIQAPEVFFTEEENIIRVIIDGLDGTGNFTRGIPLFCSAAAVLIGTQARISAIYDPIHHIVYSAVLKGPVDDPSADSTAWMWQPAMGTRVNLAWLAHQTDRQEAMQDEAIGIHLTRSHPEKLHEFIGVTSSTESLLEQLAKISGAIYALNSGVVAMTEVARGALGGFINNVTNLWDVAAGQVLVRACGGTVTNFAGGPIDYSSDQKISVVAARGPLYSKLIDAINQTNHQLHNILP